MAPDLPYVYSYLSRMVSPWDLYSQIDYNIEKLKAYARNVPLATPRLLNIVHLITFSLLLTTLAFLLLVFGKRLPALVWTLANEARGDYKETLMVGIRVVVLFLPLLLHIDLLWCALFWTTIIWHTISSRERFFVLGCLVLILYLPPLGQTIFRYVQGAEVQTVFDMYGLLYGERDSASLQRLQAWSADHPHDTDVLLTLGLAHKRDGTYASAESYYRKIIAVNPSSAEAIGNLGNVALARGETKEAITLYNKAASIDPGNGIYYFNLSKALTQQSMLRLREADRNFDRAQQLSPHVIKAHLEIDATGPNRSVIDTTVRIAALWTRLASQWWEDTGMSFFVEQEVWLRDLSPRVPFAVPAVVVPVLLFLMIVRRRSRDWWRCALCGVSQPQGYSRSEGGHRICIRCFRILHGREINMNVREKKLREIKQYKKQRSVQENLVALLLPGGGHLWKGYNARGFIYMGIFFAFIVKFAYWTGPVPLPLPSSVSTTLWSPWLIPGAFVLFYALVWCGFRRKPGRETLEPPVPLEAIRR